MAGGAIWMAVGKWADEDGQASRVDMLGSSQIL